MSKFSYLWLSAMVLLLSFSSCSKDDDVKQEVDKTKGYIYAFAPGRGAGHLVYSKELFKGEFGADKVKGLEFKDAGMLGIIRGNAYYAGQNNTGDVGVFKVSVGDKGLVKGDFIKVASYGGWGKVPIEVVGNKGYYIDHALKANAVQTFNVKSMSRTGEIVAPLADLNKYKSAETQYTYLENFLYARDGKLFTQVVYKKDEIDKDGKKTGKKVSAVTDKLVLAIFDLKTSKFEKVIKQDGHDGVVAYGYPNSRLVQEDADGNLYIGTLSDATFAAPSVIYRIKKGATDFDATVNMNVRKLPPAGSNHPLIMSFAAIGNNRALIRVFPENPHGATPGSWSEWMKRKMEIWEVDLVAKTKIKVLNIPKSVASGGSIVGLVRLDDGKVYIPVTYQTGRKTDKSEMYSYEIKTGKIEKVFTVKGYNIHEFVKFGVENN